jgi:hypothetical protein
LFPSLSALCSQLPVKVHSLKREIRCSGPSNVCCLPSAQNTQQTEHVDTAVAHHEQAVSAAEEEAKRLIARLSVIRSTSVTADAGARPHWARAFAMRAAPARELRAAPIVVQAPAPRVIVAPTPFVPPAIPAAATAFRFRYPAHGSMNDKLSYLDLERQQANTQTTAYAAAVKLQAAAQERDIQRAAELAESEIRAQQAQAQLQQASSLAQFQQIALDQQSRFERNAAQAIDRVEDALTATETDEGKMQTIRTEILSQQAPRTRVPAAAQRVAQRISGAFNQKPTIQLLEEAEESEKEQAEEEEDEEDDE